MPSREILKSHLEIEELLHEETIGYLGLSMSDDPYVVPLNYAYVEGRILLHCATTGLKIDYLKKNQRVCFAVAKQSSEVRRHSQENPCHMDSDSVVCHGRARIVEDPLERKEVLNTFNRSFDADAEEIALETTNKCCAVVIEIAEMTGRRERKQGRTHWKFSFEE